MKKTTLSGYELHFHVMWDGNNRKHYVLDSPIVYWSMRYRRKVEVPAGFISDGASGATDVVTRGWWIHDLLCITYRWDCGEFCSRWQSSVVLYDCLMEDGYYVRAPFWLVATWLYKPWGGRQPTA